MKEEWGMGSTSFPFFLQPHAVRSIQSPLWDWQQIEHSLQSPSVLDSNPSCSAYYFRASDFSPISEHYIRPVPRYSTLSYRWCSINTKGLGDLRQRFNPVLLKEQQEGYSGKPSEGRFLNLGRGIFKRCKNRARWQRQFIEQYLCLAGAMRLLSLEFRPCHHFVHFLSFSSSLPFPQLNTSQKDIL